MLKAYFKGFCYPNRDGGKMTYKILICKDDEKMYESHHHYPGKNNIASNNIADYCGFIAVLKFIENMTEYPGTIFIYGTSNLVVQQMNGNWSINHGKYYPYAVYALNKLKDMCQDIPMPIIKWIENDRF